MLAPLAVRIAVSPMQMVSEVAITLGKGFTKMVSVLTGPGQPFIEALAVITTVPWVCDAFVNVHDGMLVLLPDVVPLSPFTLLDATAFHVYTDPCTAGCVDNVIA